MDGFLAGPMNDLHFAWPALRADHGIVLFLDGIEQFTAGFHGVSVVLLFLAERP